MAKRAYHHGNLRAAMLEAAHRVLRAEGAASLTLRRVARESGVSHAAPSHHFKDVRGLRGAVAAEGFESLTRAMRANRETNDPRLRLSQLGRAYVTFATGHPALFRTMFHPSLVDRTGLPDLAAASEATFETVVETVRECQEAGVVDAGPNARELALSAWSSVHGIATLAVEGELASYGFDQSPEALADLITARIYFGLRPL